MLTPQEVSERAFPKASFGGYNMAQVDEFLDVLTEDYSALYSENAVLKSKMKVLVEKVEEYRSTEDAMRKALMTAQRMADELVKEAQDQRDQLLQQAQAEAQQQVESIRQEVEAEQYRLTCAQQETAAYVQKVKALHQQTLTYLDQLEQITPQQPQEEQPAEPDATASSVWWPRPWPRPRRRTRRPARVRTCPTPLSSPPREPRSPSTTTWSRPPASTSGSCSSAGTTRSSKSDT